MSFAVAVEAPSVTAGDRLSLTLFFAIMAHAIFILGVAFVSEDRSHFRSSTLDVILVQHRTKEAPEKPDFLAQASQMGGGESDEKARPATPLPTPFTSQTPAVVSTAPPRSKVSETPEVRPALTERRAAPAEPVPKPVLAQKKKQTMHAASTQATAKDKPKRKRQRARDATPAAVKPTPNRNVTAAMLVQRSLALASLSAELDARIQAYAKRPRRKWINASTQQYKYASYMETWRAKVERIGNLNYPDEARRRRLSGNLLLDVAIKPNGSVAEITLRRSSGHRVLDDAAIRIVRLAAPFAPLPENIRQDVDILHIERTWLFSRSHRLTAK